MSFTAEEIIAVIGLVWAACMLIDRWFLKNWVERQINEMQSQARELGDLQRECRRAVNANAAMISEVKALKQALVKKRAGS